jgi:hypothetical protein
MPNLTAHEFQTKIDDIKADDKRNSWRGPDDYFSKQHARKIEVLEERIRRVAFP